MKISIVIPVYNVENYISECIDSIKQQTYKNIEVLVVDDGSPDNSIARAKSIIQDDERFIFLTKSNGGLSDARNFGIQHATGDLITFIDSDDYVCHDYILKMVQSFVNTGSDLVVCGIALVENGIDKNECDLIEEVIDKNEALNRQYNKKYSIAFSTAWGKLAPKKWYTDTFFPFGKIHEDEFTTYQLYLKAKKIAFVDYPLYYYRIRNNSIMHHRLTIKNMSSLEAIEERIQVLQQHHLSSKLAKIALYRNLYMFKYRLSASDYAQVKVLLQTKIKKITKDLKNENLSFKEKLKCFVFKYLGKLYFKSC